MVRVRTAIEAFETRPAAAAGVWSVRWRKVTAASYAHPLLTDAVLAVLLGFATTPWLVKNDPSAERVALQFALLVPLVWRRRYPVGVFGVLGLVAFVQWVVGERLVADLSLLVALYTVAEHRQRRVALAAAAVLEVGVVMATFRWTLADSWIRTLVFLSTMAAAALLLGANVRGRRAHMATLIERAERLEHERDQQARLAAVAERTRIAREMHDVLAHSLAVIIALADGAGVKLNHEPDRAAAAIAHVSEIGRQSLRDTRRLLGVLRADDTPDPTAPQPDVSQLDDLLDRVRATGLDATLCASGVEFEVPPGPGLTVYRIVQEALTNTLKHATGARTAHVRLRYDAPQLVVDISDDGLADYPANAVPVNAVPVNGGPVNGPVEGGPVNGGPVNGGPVSAVPVNSGSVNGGPVSAVPVNGGLVDALPPGESTLGHGLAGMRERASVYQGTVEAGPRPEGGWRVVARLPVGPGGAP